jgi:orotidine-5'-phosphate decarboxylase
MTMHVTDRLEAAMESTRSIACVGLDPRPDMVPPPIAEAALQRHGDTAEAVAAAFLETNVAIIGAVAGHCAAVKPQAACYEAYGAAGWHALTETVRHAKEARIEVIIDAKRGDNGATAPHYRQAIFGSAPSLTGRALTAMTADWMTVNPYLGSDNLLALAGENPGDHGLFVLVKTSNPSSGELQDVVTDDGTVAEAVARLVHGWGSGRAGRGGLSDIGAVVGATYPREAKTLRLAMPDAMFLVPGFGSQGGDAATALAGIRPDGRGVLVSSSRSIAGAWKQEATPDTWLEATRDALDVMNKELNALR